MYMRSALFWLLHSLKTKLIQNGEHYVILRQRMKEVLAENSKF